MDEQCHAIIQPFFSKWACPMLYPELSFFENCTVNPVLSRKSKIDKIKILMTNGSLMKVESIAECLEHSAIILTCIKR